MPINCKASTLPAIGTRRSPAVRAPIKRRDYVPIGCGTTTVTDYNQRCPNETPDGLIKGTMINAIYYWPGSRPVGDLCLLSVPSKVNPPPSHCLHRAPHVRISHSLGPGASRASYLTSHHNHPHFLRLWTNYSG